MARFKDKLAEGMVPLPGGLLLQDLFDLVVGFQAEHEAELKMDEHGFIDDILTRIQSKIPEVHGR